MSMTIACRKHELVEHIQLTCIDLSISGHTAYNHTTARSGSGESTARHAVLHVT